jgi:CoA-transferase family III
VRPTEPYEQIPTLGSGLDGLKVVDWATVLAGARIDSVISDLGRDLIKLEHPTGDAKYSFLGQSDRSIVRKCKDRAGRKRRDPRIPRRLRARLPHRRGTDESDRIYMGGRLRGNPPGLRKASDGATHCPIALPRRYGLRAPGRLPVVVQAVGG